MQRDFSFSYEMPRVESDQLRQRSFSSDSHLTRPSKLETFKLSNSTSSSSSSPSANSAAMAPPNPSRYKTELCRPFQEYGFCKYGDKCQFAHGVHDLRSLPRHPKYKTELCRTFYSTGYCPYGTRCHFIHSKNEMLQNPVVAPPGSFPRPIIPPTSPSQDSGISSPDDTVSYLLGGNGKAFDFPLSDPLNEQHIEDSGDFTFPFSDCLQGGGGYSSPVDPLINDIDSLSSTSSISPVKPFKMTSYNCESTCDELVTKSSSISLDDGIFTSSSSHTRLPVFDDMLNSHSATSVETASSYL